MALSPQDTTSAALWRRQLKIARQTRRWSREELARRVLPPISASTISKIESGKVDVTATMLTRIVTALDCELNLRPINHTAHETYRRQLASDLATRHHDSIAAVFYDALITLYGPVTKP